MKRIILLMAFFCGIVSAKAQNDSLQNYMMAAARNNQGVMADYRAYQAAIQRIAPAGALDDPELQFGFYLKPMELVNGKQVATISLMQMFPWFGTLKAAKSEMAWMAEASYQKFRENGLDVMYQVEVQWYQLISIRTQIQSLKRNFALLKSLENVAVYKYKSPSFQSANTSSAQESTSDIADAPSSSGGAMSGMNGINRNNFSPRLSSMKTMSSSGMGGKMSSGSKMSDLLRLQIEEAGLQEQIESTQSGYRLALSTFNLLLHREAKASVAVPDTLIQKTLITDSASWEAIVRRNPMLAMWKAEGQSYVSKGVMANKMGYPMFGIGLEYMINEKKSVTSSSDMSSGSSSMSSMNGMDMIMPMVKISLPIYRNKYKAKVKEAELMKQSADMNYSNEADMLQTQYLLIMQRAEDAERKIKLYDKQIGLLNTTLHLMTREYASSQSDLTDILQIERELVDYELKKFEMLGTYNTIVAECDKLTAKNDFMNIK